MRSTTQPFPTRFHTRLPALLPAAALAAAAAAQPTLINLGTLPNGEVSSAFAVSDDGAVVVGSSTTTGHLALGFRWTLADGMQNTGLPAGVTRAIQLLAVNADGSAAAGHSLLQDSPASIYAPLRWTASGGMQTLAPFPGAVSAQALGISGDGAIVVGFCTADVVLAALWPAEGPAQPLGCLPGDASAVARAVSGDGAVVVGSSSSVPAGSTRAFRWTRADGMVELPPPPDGAQTVARAASRTAASIVGSSILPEGIRAVRWTPDGPAEILGAPPGASASIAYAVSDDGRVVGGEFRAPAVRAFLWTRTLGPVSLTDYLASQGVDVSGWILTRIQGISADGSTITGVGAFNNQNRAWVVTGLSLSCPVDVNDDGFVDFFDYDDFVRCFETGDCRPDAPADFNGDGFADFFDYDAFVAAYETGC